MIFVIIIKHQTSNSFIVQLDLNYFTAHQPAATNSMHLQSTYTLYLQHLSNCRHIWNPVEQLQWTFIAELVDIFGPLAIFTAPLWMFDRILNAALSNKHKGILDSPCPLIRLIHTKHKPKHLILDRPLLSYTSLKLCRCS